MDLVFDYKYIRDFYSTIFPKYTCNTNVKSFSCLKIFIYNYYFLTKSYRTLSWQSFKLLSPFTQFFQMFQNPSSPAWERTNFNFSVKALICLAGIQVWRIFFCDFKVLILKKTERLLFNNLKVLNTSLLSSLDISKHLILIPSIMHSRQLKDNFTGSDPSEIVYPFSIIVTFLFFSVLILVIYEAHSNHSQTSKMELFVKNK